MSLNCLPNEILLKICKYVVDYNHSDLERKRDLASLSSVSLRMHALVEPMLYSSLEEMTSRSLFEYLRTVLQSPRLAGHVKRYKGCHSWTSTKAPFLLRYSLRKNFKSLVQKATHNAASNEQEAHEWFEAIMDGSWDGATALVLTYLSEIQHLHLAITGSHRSSAEFYNFSQTKAEPTNYYWIHDTLMRAAQLQHQQISSPQALEHLTTITIVQNKASDRHLSMATLIPFLQLRSVTKLAADGWDLASWGTHINVQLNIVEVELSNFNLMQRFTKIFLECFPRLEKLSYNHLDIKKRVGPPQPNSFVCILKGVHPPLRELRITDSSLDPFSLKESAPLQSLSAFSGLEIIEIPSFERWVILPDSAPDRVPMCELLPSSVKKLTLRHASRVTIPHVRELFAKRHCVVNLESLTISFGEAFKTGEIEGELALLKEEGMRCGIKVAIDVNICDPIVPELHDMVEVEYDPYSSS